MNVNIQRNWWALGSSVLLVTMFTLNGCATDALVQASGLEQKIAAARTRADHEEIASLYEQQAGKDKAAAERHHQLAQVYRGRTGRNIPPDMAGHCENLASTYKQAADENLALAKEHRRLAAEMKN